MSHKQNIFFIGVSKKVKTHNIYLMRKHKRTYVQTVEMRRVIDFWGAKQRVSTERKVCEVKELKLD